MAIRVEGHRQTTTTTTTATTTDYHVVRENTEALRTSSGLGNGGSRIVRETTCFMVLAIVARAAVRARLRWPTRRSAQPNEEALDGRSHRQARVGWR